MPLLYKINSTMSNTTMSDSLIIYENLDIINNDIILKYPIATLIVIYITFIYTMYSLFSLDKTNIQLEDENEKLQEKICDLKKKNKQYRSLYKYYKGENEKLKEQNFHQENGVRKSLRVKQKNEIIEEITDDEQETDNLTDSIKEIYKLYPGMKFDDERMYKYIKKHPKLKNSQSKTPENTMNFYLQKLRHKKFLKRELIEGKYYYSE
jgi:uncharacterized protein (UPF0335 family)